MSTQNTGVPLYRPYIPGTPVQSGKSGTGSGTKAGTPSLKALSTLYLMEKKAVQPVVQNPVHRQKKCTTDEGRNGTLSEAENNPVQAAERAQKIDCQINRNSPPIDDAPTSFQLAHARCLMNNENACPTVPPLYTWDSGTSDAERDNSWDRSGTKSLKALALASLAVPLDRDKAGQSAGQPLKSCPTQGYSPRTKKDHVSSPADDPTPEQPALPIQNPRRCLSCPLWRKTPGSAWWMGKCIVSGATLDIKSVCSLTWEVADGTRTVADRKESSVFDFNDPAFPGEDRVEL